MTRSCAALNWNPLPEDANERKQFNWGVKVHDGNVVNAIAQALKMFSLANPHGSFGAQCAIMANEVAKLSAPPSGERPTADKYDEVLLPFLALMRRELHANSGKGDRPGWLSMSPEVALLEVYYHLAKLQRAVRDDDYELIAEHAADVANMAMMVLDITVDPWVLMATAGQPQPAPVVNSSNCGESATG